MCDRVEELSKNAGYRVRLGYTVAKGIEMW